MLLNLQELLSDAQALTATGPSTNIIDLGVPGTPHGSTVPLTRDIGPGEGIEIMCLINELGAGDGGDSTLTVSVQVADNEGFTGPRAVASAAITDLTPGGRWPIRFVPDTVDERYVRLSYTLGGTSPEITVSAGITAGVQTNGKG